jgi:hypothetical protein
MNMRNDDSTAHDYRESSRSEVPAETGQTAYKRQLAYRRLGIDPKDVQCVPFLATQLRRIARSVRGVDTDDPPTAPIRPLEYLRNSEDPDARKVVEAYYKVPESYRRLLRPEDFCHAAGVSPWQVLEFITVVVVRERAQVSAMLASLMLPRVVQKTVERALQDDGFRERRMMLKAVGFLPARG